MGYQTDDGVPGRDGVTTFTSHQSEILHSLIFTTFGVDQTRFTSLINISPKRQPVNQKISVTS